MALTVSEINVASTAKGRESRFKLAFDNSYPTGGEDLTAAMVGLSNIESVNVLSQEDGYTFDYDLTNTKLKVQYGGASASAPGLNSAPALQVEETQAIASNTGSLTHNPAYIIAVEVTAGSTTGAFNVIPNGQTPATTEVAVNFADGTLTFAAGDAVTSVDVTYIRQQASGLFDGSGLLAETIVAASGGTNTNDRYAAVQYVYDITGGTLLTPVPVGEAPGVGEFAIDINNSGNTTIATNAGIDGNTLSVSGLDFARLPSVDMFIDDDDITLASEAYNFTGNGNYNQLVIPGLGTQLVGEETGAGNENASWVGPNGTAANGVAQFNPALNAILTANSNAFVTTAISWLVIPSWTLVNSVVTAVSAAAAGEVANGTDLSSALNVVECIAFGR